VFVNFLPARRTSRRLLNVCYVVIKRVCYTTDLNGFSTQSIVVSGRRQLIHMKLTLHTHTLWFDACTNLFQSESKSIRLPHMQRTKN